VTLVHRRIVITSNYHPRELWTDDDQMLQAVLRRFEVTHFVNLQN